MAGRTIAYNLSGDGPIDERKLSATTIDLKFSAVVEKPENQPEWLIALSETTGRTPDELVETMLSAEMYKAGEDFIKKFSDLFRGGLA